MALALVLVMSSTLLVLLVPVLVLVLMLALLLVLLLVLLLLESENRTLSENRTEREGVRLASSFPDPELAADTCRRRFRTSVPSPSCSTIMSAKLG